MGLFRKVKSILGYKIPAEYNNREMHLLVGALLSQNINNVQSLTEAEFKVFSQFGDDGIIQYLISKLPISIEKFVEFGVENYEESNTRFLLKHNNWRGLVIDGSKDNITYIKNDPSFWMHDLTAKSAFITAENINQLLSSNNFHGKLGILSIDIDGNDYWVWKAINVVEPDIVIAEYNSLFGIDRAITIPYKPDFTRFSGHYSGLYFGASLAALNDLAEEKGYQFIGCNKAGANAYFVKKDLAKLLPLVSIKEGFVQSRFRDARNKDGVLTFANEDIRRKEISGLQVVNTRTGRTEVI